MPRTARQATDLSDAPEDRSYPHFFGVREHFSMMHRGNFLVFNAGGRYSATEDLEAAIMATDKAVVVDWED